MKNSLLALLGIVLIVGISFFLADSTGMAAIQSPVGSYGGNGFIMRIDSGMREAIVDLTLQKYAQDRHPGSVHLSRQELHKWGIQVRNGYLRTKAARSMLLQIHMPSRGPAYIFAAQNISGTGFDIPYQLPFGVQSTTHENLTG